MRVLLVVCCAVVGCLTGLGAHAQESRQLSVALSAVYKKSFDAYVIPKMKELYNVNVAASAFLSAEALSRAIAQRSSPNTSVFMMDEGPWLQGKEIGLWSKLDPALIPNLGSLPAKYKDPDGMGAGVTASLLGIMYDYKSLEANNIPVPTSLFDMWNPALKNRISIQQFSSTFAFGLLTEATRATGNDPARSFDSGFAKLKELRPNVRAFHGQAAQLIQLMQQKDIWMAWGSHFTALQAAASGAPVRWAAPKEGIAAFANYAAVVANGPNRDDAMRLINIVLSPEYQKVMAEKDFGTPTNPNVQLDPAFAKDFPGTPEKTATAVSPPWDVYNRDRVKLNERWQRELEQ